MERQTNTSAVVDVGPALVGHILLAEVGGCQFGV